MPPDDAILPLVLFMALLLVSSLDRKSTRLNSSHQIISYAVFCLKKKKNVAIDWRHSGGHVANSFIPIPSIIPDCYLQAGSGRSDCSDVVVYIFGSQPGLVLIPTS